uniref:F-box/LRR-repeat protein 7 n=1 Tax=Macrostomum lignano TaxID=282301 RepID=A0A1I8FM93_9PLAT
MMAVDWAATHVTELDITSTELSSACLDNVLGRIVSFQYLAVGYCDFFTDSILDRLMQKGQFPRAPGHRHQLHGQPERGSHREIPSAGAARSSAASCCTASRCSMSFFWTANIPLLRNAANLHFRPARRLYFELNTKVHIDQVINAFASNCQKLERLEIQWDVTTIRFSHRSGKFIDDIRSKCPLLKSLTLADCEYYEMANSNFERAHRYRVVRTFSPLRHEHYGAAKLLQKPAVQLMPADNNTRRT